MSNIAEEKSLTPAMQVETPDAFSAAEEARREKMPKTTGEWIYDNIQFWFVKGLILAATAVIGYQAKFGKETNLIHKFQEWCKSTIAAPMEKLGNKTSARVASAMGGDAGKWIGGKTAEVMAVFGGAFASTMVLFHGGNVVAPVVGWFENHRKEIVASGNRKFGKPGEEEKGNEKFANVPQQSAGDIVFGRLTAWVGTFALFFTGFLLLGKTKESGMYKLDWFEEKCARLATGMGKGSKFGHIPMNQEMHHAAKASPELFKGHEKQLFWYKVSRILALDIYATSMGIVVWTLTSRFSARDRQHKAAHDSKEQPIYGFGRTKYYHPGNEKGMPQKDVAEATPADAKTKRLEAPAASHSEGLLQQREENKGAALTL